MNQEEVEKLVEEFRSSLWANLAERTLGQLYEEWSSDPARQALDPEATRLAKGTLGPMLLDEHISSTTFNVIVTSGLIACPQCMVKALNDAVGAQLAMNGKEFMRDKANIVTLGIHTMAMAIEVVAAHTMAEAHANDVARRFGYGTNLN